MLKIQCFSVVNGSISGGVELKLQSKPALSPWATSQVSRNSCSLLNIASHCEQEYKICYYLK